MQSLNFLSKEDYYEIKLGSMLASYDRDILTILYQPIISHSALALYFTLWSEVKYSDYNPINKHEILMKKMNMDIGEIFSSRQKLEAIGLLKTYRKKMDKSKYAFSYVLYAPKNPQEFFDDVIYKGLLAKKIGAKEVERLSILFSNNERVTEGAEEVTSSFSDIYTFDEDTTLKVMNIKSGRGRKSINIQSKFEIGNFLKEIKEEEGISPDVFQPEDLKEISRIATLFGHDEKTMVEIVAHAYDKHNDLHFDYEEIFSLANKMKEGIRIFETESEVKNYNANDAFSAKLNEFNEYSPFEYLKLKQNFVNPSPADVKIINMLSTKYGFPNPVINVIVDYTLIQCDDRLPVNYVEKIASTISRKKITTALACCNALFKQKKKQTKVDEEPIENKEEDVISDEEFDKLLEGL